MKFDLSKKIGVMGIFVMGMAASSFITAMVVSSYFSYNISDIIQMILIIGAIFLISGSLALGINVRGSEEETAPEITTLVHY
jgi:hypothetical protein